MIRPQMSPCCVPSSVNSTTIHPGCPISTRISRLILKPLLPSGSPVNDLCQFSSPEHSPPCLATESITRPFQLVPLPPALTPNPPHTHTQRHQSHLCKTQSDHSAKPRRLLAVYTDKAHRDLPPSASPITPSLHSCHPQVFPSHLMR